MGFADAGWPEEQDVLGIAQILAGGQLEDLLAADGGIELSVEVFQAFQGPEVGGFGAAFQLPLMTDIHLVLKNEFKELGVAEPGGGGFLQTHGQSLGQAGEAQLTKGRFDLSHGF